MLRLGWIPAFAYNWECTHAFMCAIAIGHLLTRATILGTLCRNHSLLPHQFSLSVRSFQKQNSLLDIFALKWTRCSPNTSFFFTNKLLFNFLTLRVNLTNVLRAAFTRTVPKSTKRQSSHQCLFALLGSVHETLVKPQGSISPLQMRGHTNLMALNFKKQNFANFTRTFCKKWCPTFTLWAQFHQRSTNSFYARRSRKRKKILMT